MTEVVEISDDDPPHRAENESPLSANHAFNELKSLKTEFESKGSLLDKTCSELSNIMTRYHAQIILKHEQLDKSLIGADLSRLSRLENELREYRTENARLQKQVTDLESKIRDRDEELVQVGNGILKMKEDGIAKDKLIQKLQAQMRQEAMDHQAEITALKDVLEHSEKYGGAINSGPVTLSITGLEPKRRKVTRASVDHPQTVSKSSPQKPSPSRPSTNISSNAAIPSTSSSLKIKSSPSILPLSSGPSTRSADQSEVLDSSSETDQSFNEPLDDDSSGQPFFKLDEVNDDSNSGIEVIMPDSDVDSSAVAETKQTDRHEETQREEILLLGGLPCSSNNWRDEEHDEVETIKLQEVDCESIGERENMPTKPELLRFVAGAMKRRYMTVSLEKVDDEKETLEVGRRTSTKRQAVALTTDSLKLKYNGSSCGARARNRGDSVGDQHVSSIGRKFMCSICGKSFSTSYDCRRHRLTHTGEKPFSCQCCKKSFTRHDHLKSHLRLHTGERPHVCQICKKSFAQSTTLIYHLRTHTGERPFECEVCKKSFVKTGDLNRHRINVHTDDSIIRT